MNDIYKEFNLGNSEMPEYYLVRLDGSTKLRLNEDKQPITYQSEEVAKYFEQKLRFENPNENWIMRDTERYPLIIINDRWKSIKKIN
jgi:hypothetical protein